MAFGDNDEAEWIELRKINLLLGRNSSGKSAVIRALRLMQQSLLSVEKDQPLVFNAEGGVDLGSFNDMVHHQALKLEETTGHVTEEEIQGGEQCAECGRPLVEREDLCACGRPKLRMVIAPGTDTGRSDTPWSDSVTFSFRGGLELKDDEGRVSDEQRIQNTLLKRLVVRCGHVLEKQAELGFEVRLSYIQNNKNKQVYLWWVKFYALNESGTGGSDEVFSYKFDKENGGVTSIDYHVNSSLFPANPESEQVPDRLKEQLQIDSFTELLPGIHLSEEASTLDDDEVREKLEEVVSFCRACTDEMARFIENIVYIGPIRPLPRRTYTITDETYHKWRVRGRQSFLDYLMKQDDVRDRRINRWLQKLRLGERLSSIDHLNKRIGDLKAVVELKLDESGRGDERNFSDVGFGASQIIPVVVQCFSAQPDALVLVEQPELHLHPEAQADVADMFIECANEREQLKPEMNPRQLEGIPNELGEGLPVVGPQVERRFLIETHSETMFLRFRVELAKEGAGRGTAFPLDPHDFVCYYVERSTAMGNSTTERMLFNVKGEYENEPEGFVEFFGQDFREVLEIELARSGSGTPA